MATTHDSDIPTLDDIGRARRKVHETEAALRNTKNMPGDPDSDVGHLESEEPLRHAIEVGHRVKDATAKAYDRGNPQYDIRDQGRTDAVAAEPAGDAGGGGLLSAAAHTVSSVLGNFSESLETGMDSVAGAASTPSPGSGGGGGSVRVADMLGGSQADTPYPGGEVEAPVTPRVASGGGEESPGMDTGLPGGKVPLVEPTEQRRNDPGVTYPREGGPATTVRDSDVMVNTGPTGGGGARAQGFDFQGPQEGVTGGLLGAVREAIATFTGYQVRDSAEALYNVGVEVTDPREMDEETRLAELKERMQGMPGSMPVDKEIREMREAHAEQLAAQREAVGEAARESIASDHPEVAERMGLAEGAGERAGQGASGGGGGGLLSSLAHTFGEVLGLGGGGGGGEERRHGDGHDTASLPRRPVPVGTSPLEARPVNQTAIGVPAAANADADRASSSINTKESGREVPAGAMGAVVTDPSRHNQSYAPDFNKPFAEVEKRGLSDVLSSGAASMAAGAERDIEEMRHGGGPAPGATTSGGVADTRDIARNVERADHLDDPLQRRIYEAEVVKVAPGKTAAADRHSEAEAVKEATSAMVLGKDRQVTGAEPHDRPQGPHPAQPVKQNAGQSFFGSFGTGSAGPRRGRGAVKDAYDNFTAASGAGNGGAGGSGGWVVPTGRSTGQGLASESEEQRGQLQSDAGGGEGSLAAARRSGLAMWAARVGAAFTAKAAGGDEGRQDASASRSDPRNPTDPADYATGRIHSGVEGKPRAKEPSGKEIKDAQYLKVYEDPHSKMMHIQGANFNWDRNKDRETPQETTATDNPTLFETAGRAIHKLATGEEPEGTPPMGGFTPEGREAAWWELKDSVKDKVNSAPETVKDVAVRTEESVVGALEHMVESAEKVVGSIAGVVLRGDHKHIDERVKEARQQQEQRETKYEQDFASGAVGGAVYQRQFERMTMVPDPALTRETLVDKVLYPWSKDASTDDSRAREMAKSYNEYVREKEEKGEPYNPLGAMAHDREYDTAKLPATVQQVERSEVDISEGVRSGDNQGFLAERAPHAGQGPLPEGAKEAILSLAEDTTAHGHVGVPDLPAGLQGLKERVEEEERQGALSTRGTQSENKEADKESFRDPKSERSWHAAEVLQSNIERSGQPAQQRAAAQSERAETMTSPPQRSVTEAATAAGAEARDRARDATQQAARSVGETAGQTRETLGSAAGYVKGAAQMAGEETSRAVGAVQGGAQVVGEQVRGAAERVVGTVRGAAEVARDEARGAVGAAQGASQVAAEEASRGAGKLFGAVREGLRSLVGGGGSGSRSSSTRGASAAEPAAPEAHDRHRDGQHGSSRDIIHPPKMSYSEAPQAITNVYNQQQQQQPQRDKSVTTQTGEAVRSAAQDVGARAEGAARVAGSVVQQTKEGVQEAGEKLSEDASKATDQARETTGGILGALKDMFIGGGDERRERELYHEDDIASRGDTDRSSRTTAADKTPPKSTGLVDMAPCGPGMGEIRPSEGSSDIGPGVNAEGIAKGLGEVLGGVAGVLEKVMGGGGERGGGQDTPVVPYTSTAEILAARQEREEGRD